MERKISLVKSEILFTSDDDCSKSVTVLFLPGISGKAFSERFQPLVDMCKELKLSIARVEAWNSESDVQSKTWSHYHQMLSEVIEQLLDLKYTKIVTIGKSFGGGLLLSYHDKNICKKILWAPAIGVGEEDTLTRLKNTTLSEIHSLLDIQLNKEFIHTDPSAICVIHGTKDDVMPIENSRKAVSVAKTGALVEVENADHSFKTCEGERSLMEATRSFLSSEL
ncbi:MAG: hypothetical protein KBD24_04055 [Candidatus Pacebacteria bacterium]|nr:hypothetical protein [Candidatus Paceibacterota bacterium]